MKGGEKMRKDVFLGKADYRYFVDIRCDGNHEGNCGSKNPLCSCENLACGEPYADCKRLAVKASKKHGIPLINDVSQR
jgi:hypothetical protein